MRLSPRTLFFVRHRQNLHIPVVFSIQDHLNCFKEQRQFVSQCLVISLCIVKEKGYSEIGVWWLSQLLEKNYTT